MPICLPCQSYGGGTSFYSNQNPHFLTSMTFVFCIVYLQGKKRFWRVLKTGGSFIVQQHKTGPPLFWGDPYRILTKHFAFCVATATTETDILADFDQLCMLEKECSMKQWEKLWTEQNNEGWVGTIAPSEEEAEKHVAEAWERKRRATNADLKKPTVPKVDEDSPDWERIVLNRVTDYVVFKGKIVEVRSASRLF